MHMVEPKPSSALGIIQEENNLHYDGTRTPDNSLANTPCAVPNDFDFSIHRRRDSIPNVDKLIRLEHKIDCPGDVICCKYTPDASMLAVGLVNGSIMMIKCHDPQIVHYLEDEDTTSHHLPVTQIRYPGRGEEDTLIASYASGHIKLWHYKDGNCLQTMTEDRQLLNIAYSPDGRRFVTMGDTPEIYVYDRDTRKKINSLEASVTSLSFSPIEKNQKLDGHCFRVFAAQYHPDENHLFISGGWDDTVHYWDDRQKHSIRSISGPHICGDALEIDPVNKRMLLTGSWRRKNPLEVWDFDTGKKLKDIPPESSQRCQLYCCQWLGNESILCGGSDGNLAKVVNWITISTKGLLSDLPQGVYCIDNDRSGLRPYMAVGSKNNIYILKPEKDC